MSQPSERPPARVSRSFLLKLAVSATLLILIFSRFEPGELWQVIRTAEWPFLLMALLVTAPILLGKALKWYLLGRQVTDRISFGESTLALLAGIGIGFVTPGRIGEVARVSYLPVPDKSRFVGLVAVDRLLDLSTVILVGAVAIALSLNMRLAGAALVLPALAALTLLFIPQLPTRLVRRLAGVSFMPGKRHIHLVAEGLSVLGGRILALTFLISLLIFAVGTYQFYWLLRSFQAPDSLVAAIVSFPILTLAGVLPVTVGGFGTREGASVLVLSLYNVPEAVAVNAALVSFVLNTLIPGVLGLILTSATATTTPADPPVTPVAEE